MELHREESLSQAIYFLSLEIQNVLDRMLKPYSVTMEQLYLLKVLSKEDTELTQREICQKTSKTPANITRFIDRLESKLFVTRQSSPKDRRVCIVVLARQGRSLLQEVDIVLNGDGICDICNHTISRGDRTERTILDNNRIMCRPNPW